MARGRFLNRSVTTDDKVAKLMELGGPLACLFHHRLIAFLDRNGNVRADKWWLKASLFPLDDDVSPDNCQSIARLLPACGLAIAYQQAGGQLFLHFPTFTKNQPNLRPEKEKPECPIFDQSLQVELNQGVVYGRSIDGLLTGDGRAVPAKNPPISESESESESVLSILQKEYSPDLPEPKSADADWMSDIVTQWNQMATELGYPKVSRLTPDRKKHLTARNKEPAFHFPAIVQAFKTNKPKILSGKNGSEWKPDFDFVIRSETTYTQILEGKFSTNGNSNGSPKVSDDWINKPETRIRPEEAKF